MSEMWFVVGEANYKLLALKNSACRAENLYICMRTLVHL